MRTYLTLRVQPLLARLWNRGEEGQALVEYTLILALLSIAAILTLTSLGSTIVTALGNVASAL